MTQLPPNRTEWPPIWLEVFSERAAIIEYQANMTRKIAEQLAEEDTRRWAEKS